MELPSHLYNVLDKLNQKGFEAYAVGGCVRDSILGLPLFDFDITTSAKVDEIKEVFADFKTIDTGIKHGTVTLILDGITYEITTFRSDGEYLDNRRPESVTFVASLKEDLKRRDFTINALAYSKSTGIIDLFGGLEDLKNGIIRAVGEPTKRFDEDALRILRAIRFSAKLGFEIEENTKNAMILRKKNLKNISFERIFAELTKTLTEKNSHNALYHYFEVISTVLPELTVCYGFDQKSLSHDYDVYLHTLKSLEILEKRTPILVWAVLLHDIGKPCTCVFGTDGYNHFPKHMFLSVEIAEKILTRLKAGNDFKRRVLALIRCHDDYFNDKYSVKKFLNEYDEELFEDLIALKKADLYAHSQHGISKYESFYFKTISNFNKIRKNGECYRLEDLKISGNDLIDLGFEDIKIGEVKNKLLDMVMRGEIANEYSQLVFEATKMIENDE